jgi:hypothetical protein
MTDVLCKQGTKLAHATILKVVNGILLSVAMSAPGIAEAAPFPEPLLGKSVTLNWNENQQRKFEDTGEVTFPTFSHSLGIYISTAGRAFTRELNVPTGGRGPRRGPFVSDQAPDDSRSSTGDKRFVHFERGALLVDNHLIAGTRDISITFGPGYDSCNARVTYDRAADGGPVRMQIRPSGRRFELVSIQTSTPSCSIRSGNVLVEQ